MNRRILTALPFAVATIALLGWAAAAPAAAALAPPSPIMVAGGGVHRHLALGSYCWSDSRRGICVDAIDPIEHAPTILVPAGTEPTIRMGYPVSDLLAVVQGDILLELHPIGEGRKKFSLTLPDFLGKGPTDIYLQATYARGRGDALFAVRVKSS